MCSSVFSVQTWAGPGVQSQFKLSKRKNLLSVKVSEIKTLAGKEQNGKCFQHNRKIRLKNSASRRI